jgi:hypothetical protein
MPDQDAVSMTRRLLGGFHERSRRPDLAIVMYCRAEGASNAEVRSATGDTWTNKARRLHLDGKSDFMKAKMPGGELRYFVGPLGSHPGPLNAQPFLARPGDHSEPLNRSTCTSKPLDTVDRSARSKGELHHGGPSEMQATPKQIVEIVERLKAGQVLPSYKVQSIREWFEAEQPGANISDINAALASCDLETIPSIDEAKIDGAVSFHLTATDDYLEPEVEDEQPTGTPDDGPVSVQIADWTIQTLRLTVEGGNLTLQPKFQREYVWSLKPELPSRLIESLLLQIPIPPIYFYNDTENDNTLEVIDGQQRLTTLIDFISNKFALRKLNRMPSLNQKFFKDLPKPFQNTIRNTAIRTITINAHRNSDLRYEVFERLNRGSMALNEQELRNCVYRGPFNDLLAELERDIWWRKVKGGDDPEPRFKEREMILRFFAFADRLQHYTGNLKRFLNGYMANYAPHQADALSAQATLFKQTMQNIYTVFGKNSARLYVVNPRTKLGDWDTKFSVTAFDIQASALMNQHPMRVQRSAEQIKELFLFTWLTDTDIQAATTKATGSAVQTKIRWTRFRTLVEPIIGGTAIEPRFFGFEFRKQLFERSPLCQLCKNEIHSLEDSTVDHIIPYSKGGKTIPNNGQLAHRGCNASKNADVAATEVIE